MPRQNQSANLHERIVVDELLDNGKARILRASRRKNSSSHDFHISVWGKEKEEFISKWKLEAFVGFPTKRKLSEGDVFFIKDGTMLNDQYEGEQVIERDRAAQRHLLIPVEDSTHLAREEIRAEFSLLTVDQLPEKENKTRLKRIVKENIKKRMKKS